jgi:GR25 family glycosyltransferase involved in LPS biosynthesis
MGQIQRGTDIGDYLYRLGRDDRFKNYVEIGTWNGQGSTKCILDGILERPAGAAHLYSVENDVEKYAQAVNFWKNCSALTLLFGRVAGRDDFMTSEEARRHPLFASIREHYDRWYAIERANYEKSADVRDRLPSSVDVLFLDGSEFSTSAEWRLLREKGIKVVALDDVDVVKCHDIFRELVDDNSWQMVFRGPTRNGSAAFERKSAENPISGPPLRFFNLDLRISVIADIREILATLFAGQAEVVNWSISGHNWVFGRSATNVRIIDASTWHNIDARMAAEFQEAYDPFLQTFDAFVVTHTPVFCMLYEKYGKPILLVNSCRYDQPFCWTKNEENRRWLNEGLLRMQRSGQLVAISNNKGDQAYLLRGAGVTSVHIPSLCAYTKAKHRASKSAAIVYGDRSFFPPCDALLPCLPRGYTWTELYSYQAIVHVPYEVSTMSLFEQYSAGVPLFLPSRAFYENCLADGSMRLQSDHAGGGERTFWLDRADYYDPDNFKYVYFYSSRENLVRQIAAFHESEEVRASRAGWLETRAEVIFCRWRELLNPVLRAAATKRATSEQASASFPKEPAGSAEVKVFSFCIYGRTEKYCRGLVENLKIIRRDLPDYEAWIVAAEDVPANYLAAFAELGGKVTLRSEPPGPQYMFFRFLPIDDARVEIMFSRDADGRINKRDVWCVREFERSERRFHVIRDHYFHKNRVMGGTFGMKRGALPLPMAKLQAAFLATRTAAGKMKEGYGVDEAFLGENVYPRVKRDLLLHTNVWRFKDEANAGRRIELPDSDDFVGNVYDFDGGGQEARRFDYTSDLHANIADHLLRLRCEEAWELVLHICSSLRLGDFEARTRYTIIDEWYIAGFYAGIEVEACQKILELFGQTHVDEHIIANSNHLFPRLKAKGLALIGTCDPEREPGPGEVILSYGSYPHCRDNLPWSRKIFRHALYSDTVELDRFECDPCWSAVSQIYVLNLAERRDRLTEIMAELCRMSAPLDRVTRYTAQREEITGDHNADANIGATKNHLFAVRDFLARPEGRHCLILEDDLTFSSHVERHKKDLRLFFERNYDYDVCLIAASKYWEMRPFDDLLSRSFQKCTTTAGYLLSRSGAQKILPLFEEGLAGLLRTKDTTTYAVDRYWSRIQGDQKFFVFNEKFGYQRPSYSSITRQIDCHFD